MREIIELVVGKLVEAEADAIVSPANNESLLNTTVGSELAVFAGKELSQAANKAGKIGLGEAVVTPAGRLKAKAVIHAACMNYSQTTNEEVLVQAMRNALLRARESEFTSIAMPPLEPTGITFPLKRCAELMVSEVIRHTEKEAILERAVFVLKDEVTQKVFEEVLRQT